MLKNKILIFIFLIILIINITNAEPPSPPENTLIQECGNHLFEIGEECECEVYEDYSGEMAPWECSGKTCDCNTCECYKCGDGIIEASEQCESNEDCNEMLGEYCKNCKCTTIREQEINPKCGNYRLEIGEECECGIAELDSEERPLCEESCDCETCKCSKCGNEIIEGTEECDLGLRNNLRCGADYNENCSFCNSNCQNESIVGSYCGDGIWNHEYEECDWGELNGNEEDCNITEYGEYSYCCNKTCNYIRVNGPKCGDNNTDFEFGEECDDGNFINNDACTNDCKNATCGDGIKWEEHEECDDGNDNNNDDCLNNCRRARCGDGFILEETSSIFLENVGEECDSSTLVNACPEKEQCFLCQCVSKHEPYDTLCEDNDHGNYEINLVNEKIKSCQAFNVISEEVNYLDYIVDEALDCCEGKNQISKKHELLCRIAKDENITTRDCLTKFIGMGLRASYEDSFWINGYFTPELCCREDDNCLPHGTKGECTPNNSPSSEKPFNSYIQSLTCDNFDCNFHYQPALITAQRIESGTCVDWSFLTTTLLRKTGYFYSWTSRENQFSITDITFGDINNDGIDEIGIALKANLGPRWMIFDNEGSIIHEGGTSLTKGKYATSISFGNVDDDENNEVGVTYREGELINDSKVIIYDDIDAKVYGGFRVIKTYGNSWDEEAYATDIDFGDIDGDGKDEIGITRYSTTGPRVFILKREEEGHFHPYNLIKTFGDGWGRSAYATSIKFDDVDNDGKDEIGVTRFTTMNERAFIYDDSLNSFRNIATFGERWGRNAYATSIDFGDVDGDRKKEIGITRFTNEGPRAFIYDDYERFNLMGFIGEDWDHAEYATDIAFGDLDNDFRDEIAISLYNEWDIKNGRIYEDFIGASGFANFELIETINGKASGYSTSVDFGKFEGSIKENFAFGFFNNEELINTYKYNSDIELVWTWGKEKIRNWNNRYKSILSDIVDLNSAPLGFNGHASNLVWSDEYGKYLVINYGEIYLDPNENPDYNLCNLENEAIYDAIGQFTCGDDNDEDNCNRRWVRDWVYGCEDW